MKEKGITSLREHYGVGLWYWNISNFIRDNNNPFINGNNNNFISANNYTFINGFNNKVIFKNFIELK